MQHALVVGGSGMPCPQWFTNEEIAAVVAAAVSADLPSFLVGTR